MTVPLCCYKTVNCGWGLSDDQLLHCLPPDEDEKEKKDDPANKVGEKIEGYPAIFVPNLKWVGLVELDAGTVWRSNSHWGDSCALCKAHQIFHCLLLFNHFSSLSCRLLNKMTHCSQPIASEEGRVVLFSACQTHSRCSLALSVVRPMPRWDTCATHQNPPALHFQFHPPPVAERSADPFVRLPSLPLLLFQMVPLKLLLYMPRRFTSYHWSSKNNGYLSPI